jgi:hypothetical protein
MEFYNKMMMMMWNLGTNSAFALDQGKLWKTLIELVGRRTFQMQTDY